MFATRCGATPKRKWRCGKASGKIVRTFTNLICLEKAENLKSSNPIVHLGHANTTACSRMVGLASNCPTVASTPSLFNASFNAATVTKSAPPPPPIPKSTSSTLFPEESVHQFTPDAPVSAPQDPPWTHPQQPVPVSSGMARRTHSQHPSSR